MTSHTLAPHLTSLLAADKPTPLFPSLSAVPPRSAPAAAAPVGPQDVSLVVERTPRAEFGTCALCWSGPQPLAGRVRQVPTRSDAVRQVCSRCMVTLEMLAVQFVPHLRLAIETSA